MGLCRFQASETFNEAVTWFHYPSAEQPTFVIHT